LISDNGRSVGFVVDSKGMPLILTGHDVIYGNSGNNQLYDLNSTSPKDLKNQGWVLVNPSAVYDSVEKWYLDKSKL
jgi:hypothetical protein